MKHKHCSCLKDLCVASVKIKKTTGPMSKLGVRNIQKTGIHIQANPCCKAVTHQLHAAVVNDDFLVLDLWVLLAHLDAREAQQKSNLEKIVPKADSELSHKINSDDSVAEGFCEKRGGHSRCHPLPLSQSQCRTSYVQVLTHTRHD